MVPGGGAGRAIAFIVFADAVGNPACYQSFLFTFFHYTCSPIEVQFLTTPRGALGGNSCCLSLLLSQGLGVSSSSGPK